MKILYTGLQDETLQWIKQHPYLVSADFVPLIDKEVTTALASHPDSGILLIGEQTGNPIQLAQQVQTLDPYLSILLIGDRILYPRLRQALQLAPFIGPTIQSVSNEGKNGLGLVVENHLTRTTQRRNYARIKSSLPDLSIPNTQGSERIKADFANRAFEEAPIGIILLGEHNVVLSTNPFAVQLLGRSEKNLLGKKLPDLFSESQRQALTAYLSQASHISTASTFELSEENREKFLEIKLRDLQAPGTGSYRMALLTDVTDQVLARRAAQDQIRHRELILESLPDIAWSVASDGTTFVNKKWFEYIGIEPDQTHTFQLQEYIHPEDASRTFARWNDSQQSGKPFEMEYRLRRGSDQRFRWMLSRARPIPDSKGQIACWVGTITDIEALKNTEQELQHLAKEMAASNEELAAANEEILTSNDELSEANRKLIQVNADLDNFIYTASHDLKAPIANIDGLVMMLEKKLETKNWRDEISAEIFKRIHSSVVRFRDTIADLTEITKLQKQSGERKELISLEEVLQDIRLDLSNDLLDTNTHLKIDVEACQVIFFSRKNLKSIFYNLLSNAIKYRSPKRSPRISVSCHNQSDYVVLAVSDNGLGIAPEDQEKAFDMFRRLHTHVEGSGIGLYIVKRIVDNAEGKIELESEVGVGSTFRIFIKKPKNSESAV